MWENRKRTIQIKKQAGSLGKPQMHGFPGASNKKQEKASARNNYTFMISSEDFDASCTAYPKYNMQRANSTKLPDVKLLSAKKKKKKKPCTDRLFPKMGECREVLGGGPAPPSKL